MAEIAICLAIIGIALVAIIGVLPWGMNVQRHNREETIINQDASVILESLRNGVMAGGDLTNYIFAVTNYWATWTPNTGPGATRTSGYGYTGASLAGVSSPFALNSNSNIIGVLSTPEFTSGINSQPLTTRQFLQSGGISNHVLVYARSVSGPVVEKPPQDNPILIGDSFSYRFLCVNAPPAMDTNSANQVFDQQLAANLHEVSLIFNWPLQPNGTIGHVGPLTQRATFAGSVFQSPSTDRRQPLYFYQSQLFTNAP